MLRINIWSYQAQVALCPLNTPVSDSLEENMEAKIGIVAFSFSQRDVEPNPCNVRLGRAVKRAVKRYGREHVYIVAQWEIATWLTQFGSIGADHTVWPPKDGSYLGSEGVWGVARTEFKWEDITDVISIEQPFLQRRKTHRLIKADRFEILPFEVGKIGFDPESNQPWCRSRRALMKYAIKQMLTSGRGFNGQQKAA